jgi:hypothetical protein
MLWMVALLSVALGTCVCVEQDETALRHVRPQRYYPVMPERYELVTGGAQGTFLSSTF